MSKNLVITFTIPEMPEYSTKVCMSRNYFHCSAEYMENLIVKAAKKHSVCIGENNSLHAKPTFAETSDEELFSRMIQAAEQFNKAQAMENHLIPDTGVIIEIAGLPETEYMTAEECLSYEEPEPF